MGMIDQVDSMGGEPERYIYPGYNSDSTDDDEHDPNDHEQQQQASRSHRSNTSRHAHANNSNTPNGSPSNGIHRVLDRASSSYASRDVEVYASSFAPPNLDSVASLKLSDNDNHHADDLQRRQDAVNVTLNGGHGGGRGEGGKGGGGKGGYGLDDYAEDEGDVRYAAATGAASYQRPYDDGMDGDGDGGDVIVDDAIDVRVRRDVQRRLIRFFGSVLLLALVVALVTVPSGVVGLRKPRHKAITAIPLQPPPEDLDNTCSEAGATGDPLLIRQCVNGCNQASCCTVEDPTDLTESCAGSHPVLCGRYDQACSLYDPILFNDSFGSKGMDYGEPGGTKATERYKGQRIPYASEELADKCNPDKLAMDRNGERRGCRRECAEWVNCCQDEYCRGNNEEACDSYEPCQILDSYEDSYEDEDLDEGYDEDGDADDEEDVNDDIGEIDVVDVDVDADSAEDATTNEKSDASSGSNIKLTAAPDDIALICSYNSLLSGGLSARSECQDLCAEYKGCCDSGDSQKWCTGNSAEVCDTYEPCDNLLQNNVVEAAPYVDPADVATLCHGSAVLTSDGLDRCRDACQPGLCCLVSPLVGQEGEDSGILSGLKSCREEKGAATCKLYSECEVLLEMEDRERTRIDETKDVPADSAASVPAVRQSEIDEVCSRASVNTNAGFKACKSACIVARCCWSVGEYGCALDMSASRCEAYESCARLEGREPGLDILVEDDGDEESLEIVEQWDDTYDEDEDYKDLPNTNYKDSPSIGYEGYSSTGGFSSSVVANRAKIEEMCSRSSILTSRGEKECERLCEPGSCCATGSCGGNGIRLDCNMYKPCSNLESIREKLNDKAEISKAKHLTGNEQGEEEEQEEEQEKGKTSNSDGMSMLEKAEQVMDTCSASNLVSSTGRRACEKICLSHLCCFTQENDCAQSPGNQCLVYAGCKALAEFLLDDR